MRAVFVMFLGVLGVFELFGDWSFTQCKGDELKGLKPYSIFSYETNGCVVVFYDNTKDFKLICPRGKIFDWKLSDREGMEGRSGCEITVGLYKNGKLIEKSVLAMYDQTTQVGYVYSDINRERMEARKALKEHNIDFPIYKTALDISRVYNCVRTTNCYARIIAPYFDDADQMDLIIPFCSKLPARKFKK